MQTFLKMTIVALLLLALTSAILGIYGIILAFKTHLLIGVATLVVPPLAFLTGAFQFFFDVNIPAAILQVI